MINKKKYFIITFGVLVSIIFVGAFIRPHKTLNNSTIVTESNQLSSNTSSVNIETSSTKEESKDVKNAEIINYTVKAGDTVKTIADLYGVNTTTIAVSNGISENTALKEGQALRFPSVNGVLYKVNNNETLWDIALVYNKNVNELIKVNSLENPNKLKLNQELFIPDANKLLKVKDNSDNRLLAKTETPQKTLSRGGSISSAIKASSTKVAWPLRGSITSPFGIRSRDNHTGIDISASIGTPIKAASNGKVVYAGWQDGYGNLLIIQASSGLQTYYAHTSKILVNLGRTVSEGQVVAEVGMSGRTTGPHLHFEVRKNGSPVNPLNYLR